MGHKIKSTGDIVELVGEVSKLISYVKFKDGKQMYIPTALLEEVEEPNPEELTLRTIPAIERLEELRRYFRAVDWDWFGKDNSEDGLEHQMRALMRETEAEVIADIRTLWGL